MSPKIIVKKILLQLSHFYVIQRFPYNPVSIEPNPVLRSRK